MLHASRKQKGFALVEVLVYLAILVTVSTSSVLLLISLDDLLSRYQIETALYRSGTNALEQIMAELREASSYDALASVEDVAATGKLVLQNGGVTTEFAIAAGALELTVDGDNKGNLLNDTVTVTGFTVHKYDTSVGTLVRVKLDLQASVDGAVKDFTFYDGAVIRGDL